MTHEINKPSEPTYFVFYGGAMNHVGVCMPGSVTTTGQPYAIIDNDPASWLLASAQIDMPDLPELPAEGEQVTIDIYQYEGIRVICRNEHIRTGNPPMDEPQYFTVSV